jgi:hypothetical protein
MSVNKAKPYVYVLPEDRANSALANGFHLELDQIRQMQVLPVADGWTKVLDEIKTVHIGEMNRDANRFMVLLIDFDGKANRLDYAKTFIPAHLTDRVFILGVWTKPEHLKGKLEGIGAALAKDCREGTSQAWDQPLLGHNKGEVARLRERVRPFLLSVE